MKSNLLSKIKKFFEKSLYNQSWRCAVCGKEIFEGDFCADCEKKLPFIKNFYCDHCGRETLNYEFYCTTCKGNLTGIDKGRSVFNYKEPISGLIRLAKYGGRKYLLNTFAEYMFFVYVMNFVNADVIAYIPMTERVEKRRGYNQSKVLAELLSEKTGLPVFYGAVKKRDTEHQASLTREERSKNLLGVFGITQKKLIKDKKVLLVDDVTTTGATAQVFSKKLKSAGANYVFLLTVASVPPKDGY